MHSIITVAKETALTTVEHQPVLQWFKFINDCAYSQIPARTLCHVDILIQGKVQEDLRLRVFLPLPEKWRHHENSWRSSSNI